MSKGIAKLFRSVVRRPIQHVNVENRAQREIDRQQNQPTPAPKYEHAKASIQRDMADSKDDYESQLNKNEGLLTRMEGMIAEPDKFPEIESRPLPTDREAFAEPEYGYLEPVNIPRGKCSLKQAVEFIQEHDAKPGEVSNQTIATQYIMDPEKVKEILKHFRMMKLHIPQELLEQQQQKKMDASSFMEAGKNKLKLQAKKDGITVTDKQ